MVTGYCIHNYMQMNVFRQWGKGITIKRDKRFRQTADILCLTWKTQSVCDTKPFSARIKGPV